MGTHSTLIHNMSNTFCNKHEFFVWVVLEWFVRPEDIPFPLNYLSHSWHFTTKPKLHFLSISFFPIYMSLCQSLSMSLFYLVSLCLFCLCLSIALSLLSLCMSYLSVSPIYLYLSLAVSLLCIIFVFLSLSLFMSYSMLLFSVNVNFYF